MKKNNFVTATAILCFSLSGFAFAAGPDWSYSGKTGPADWGNLSAEFQTCKLGMAQAPLNINTQSVEKATVGPIKTLYTPTAGEVVNNGHTIQVNLANGGQANLGGKDYKILQYHFHTPSEETLDGKAYPLNVHMVHQSSDGKLAVIGVFFKEGKENLALKDIFANLPAQEGKVGLKANFDASTLLASSTSFYSYVGSLTTPPCSEGVSFYILKNPIEMSQAQLAAFQKVFPMNARPVQPLNGRKITELN